MPPWRTPESGKKVNTKFIRIGERIFVGETSVVGHLEIAILDGIEAELDSTRLTHPDELDAGRLYSFGEDGIAIMGDSSSLQIPVFGHEKPARDETVEVFRKLSPSNMIVDLTRRR